MNVLAASAEDTLSLLAITDFKYHHIRALAKLGLAWERGPMRFGLNVTTPSVGLFGSGDVGYTGSLIGVDSDGDGSPDPPLLISQTRTDLDATYRSSWAIGGGFAWYRGATRWHTSAEWFAPVDRFTVLELPLQDGDPQTVLTQQLKSVFNVGLGVEHEFENGTAAYGAFLTDFSAAVGDPDVNVTVSNWDLYRLSAGVKFAFAGTRFTLGATYSFGNRARPLDVGIPPQDLPADVLDESLDIGFLFGSNR